MTTFRLHVSPSRDAEPKLWAPAWYLELTCARGYLSRLFRIVATSCQFVRDVHGFQSCARWSSVCLIGTCFCSKGYCGQEFGPQAGWEWWVTPWYHYHPLLFRVSTTHLSGTRYHPRQQKHWRFCLYKSLKQGILFTHCAPLLTKFRCLDTTERANPSRSLQIKISFLIRRFKPQRKLLGSDWILWRFLCLVTRPVLLALGPSELAVKGILIYGRSTEWLMRACMHH